jgi:predicted ATPase
MLRHYRLGEQLGEGGMGIVFRALDVRTEKPVAIKALKPAHMSANPSDIERFLREGAALKALEHPNIVKVLEMFEENAEHYLVMELVEGGSLERVLAASAPLPLARVLGLALDLSDALSRAHRIGIVHRDLKPANVLLAADGTPRLCDFGVAHIAGQARLSAANGIVGTLEYLSPEILSGEVVDARSDVWAFGVLLFEMLAGRRPFAAAHPAATLHAILHAAPPELEALRPDCPTALVDLVYRMLDKSRHERIPSARQVGAELERIVFGMGEAERSQFTARARGALAVARTVAGPHPSTAPAPRLPAQTTPFVGREAELAELARLLRDNGVRLVTVLGPGGMGKSRLALEAAQQLAQGTGAFEQTEARETGAPIEVFFVELAPLARAELVLGALAEAVGFEFYPGTEPKAQLLAYLHQRRALLVLDNFEHLLDAATLVNELLLAVPDLQVLATSRERLGLSGEHAFVLSGLPVPEADARERWDEFASIQLFADSARRVKRDFELGPEAIRATADICRLVQGLPLGIVLAASWSNLLGAAEIAEEIGKSFDFLQSELKDVPARQHSLRAVFDYSHDLLGPSERAVFIRLAVFRGGFTRAAAEDVAAATLRTLGVLLDKSLVARDPTTGRYGVHELLRQYAEGRVQALPGEAARLADAHAEHYAGFVARLTTRFKGTEPELAAAELEAELDNVRAAFSHVLATKNLRGTSAFLEGLALLYAFRSAFVEGEIAFKAAVESLAEPPPERGSECSRLLARALTLQAAAGRDQWRNSEAVVLAERALALLDERTEPAAFAHALLVQATASLRAGNVEPAFEASEHALRLYREVGERWELSRALATLGQYAERLGIAKAEACVRESIELQRALSCGRVLDPTSLTELGDLLCERGRHAEGSRLLLEALSLLEIQGKSYGKLRCLQRLSNAQRRLGEYDAAEANARLSLELARERFPFVERWSQALLGDALRARGKLDDAIFHFRASMADGNPLASALAAVNLGDIAAQRGDYVRASALIEQGLAAFERHGPQWGIAVACEYLGSLACDEGRLSDAKLAFRRGLNAALETQQIALAMNTVAGLARASALAGESERALELLSLLERQGITEYEVRTRFVTPLLAELSSRLPADTFEAALLRGRTLELSVVLRELAALP